MNNSSNNSNSNNSNNSNNFSDSDSEDKVQDYSIIEEFIKNNKPSESGENCFSPKHIIPKRNAWNKISTESKQNFIIFALEGYTNYGYYRSSNGSIYMVELYLGKLDSYQLIK
jgi:hypothetical protein